MRFGLLNVQIEGGVEHADCLSLVAFESPLNLSFQKGMLTAFALRFTHLQQEFKLLSCIVEHLLLDAAVDHSIER